MGFLWCSERRGEGTTGVKCPYCMKKHDHDEPGHHVAGFNEDDRYNGIGVAVGERYFVPNFGCTIYEYKEGDGVNELIALN